MPIYVVEHHDAPREGCYAPRGAVRQLWRTRDFETMVSGPSETGKTYGCLMYLNALCWKYPGSQHVIARKKLNSIAPTVLPTWRRVLGAGTPVRTYGGSKPEWYDYPNGSRVWLAGLDDTGKALSSERDTIYVNQAEELKIDDWEVMTTRVTGRGAVMPYTRIFGDCNPREPSHWIKHRRSLKLLESRHEDNPTLYDAAGMLTEQGHRTMAVLNALTGARKLRLRFGRWVQAEGVVYEGWDQSIHVIDKMPLGWRYWRKIRSIDFGFANPFVCQWWAIDGDGRMYLYREIYYSHRIVEDHCKGVFNRRRELVRPGIVALGGAEQYEMTVADHDREGRMTAARYGVPSAPAYKDTETGIQAVAARLNVQPDGKPRLFVVNGCTVEYDPYLLEHKKPTCTEQEPDSYLWHKGKDGQPVKEEPVKENDHGMDAMRYAVAYEDLRQKMRYVVSDDVQVFN